MQALQYKTQANQAQLEAQQEAEARKRLEAEARAVAQARMTATPAVSVCVTALLPSADLSVSLVLGSFV